MKCAMQSVNTSLFLFRLIIFSIIFYAPLLFFSLPVHADSPVNPAPVPSFDLPFNVDHSGTTTWYSMNLVSGQGITVVMDAHLNSGSIAFGIYDMGGSILGANSGWLGDGATGRLNKTIEENGIYYIQEGLLQRICLQGNTVIVRV